MRITVASRRKRSCGTLLRSMPERTTKPLRDVPMKTCSTITVVSRRKRSCGMLLRSMTARNAKPWKDVPMKTLNTSI